MLPRHVALAFALWIAGNLLVPRNSMTMRLYESYGRQAREEPLRALYDGRYVEYPHLAVALMAAVGAAADALTPLWRAVLSDEPGSDAERAEIFGRTWCLLGYAAQALLFAALARWAGRLHPGEGERDRARRLLGFFLGSLLLSRYVFTRLDGLMAALLFASTALLLRGRWIASFALLAAAIDLKLVPIALVPLFVLGSLPRRRLAEAVTSRAQIRLLGDFSARAALVGALVLAFALPFHLQAGPRSLVFLRFHAYRGIQCESTFAGILYAARLFGAEVRPHGAFGSWDVASPLAPRLVALSTILLAAATAAVHLLAFAGLRRRAREGDAPGTVAESQGTTIVTGIALLLLLTPALSKVFSGQFALWALPFAALLPLRGRARLRFQALLVLSCGMAAYAFQLFANEAAGGGPAPRTAALLLVRGAILLGLVAWLAVEIARTRPRPEPAG